MALSKRSLGAGGPIVSAIGLGCIGMSEFYGGTDRNASLATLATALEDGVTLFDTGDFYGMGDNETLLADGLAGKRDQAFIQVKCGALRDPSGSFLGVDARPATVKTALSYSLKRLRTDYVDLYMTAPDPAVPIEDTIGAFAEMVEKGYIRHIGVTNVDAALLRRAHATHPITALQCEYVAQIAFICVRPEMPVSGGLYQLGGDPHPIARAEHCPFHNRVHIEFTRDL